MVLSRKAKTATVVVQTVVPVIRAATPILASTTKVRSAIPATKAAVHRNVNLRAQAPSAVQALEFAIPKKRAPVLMAHVPLMSLPQMGRRARAEMRQVYTAPAANAQVVTSNARP